MVNLTIFIDISHRYCQSLPQYFADAWACKLRLTTLAQPLQAHSPGGTCDIDMIKKRSRLNDGKPSQKTGTIQSGNVLLPALLHIRFPGGSTFPTKPP